MTKDWQTTIEKRIEWRGEERKRAFRLWSLRNDLRWIINDNFHRRKGEKKWEKKRKETNSWGEFDRCFFPSIVVFRWLVRRCFQSFRNFPSFFHRISKSSFSLIIAHILFKFVQIRLLNTIDHHSHQQQFIHIQWIDPFRILLLRQPFQLDSPPIFIQIRFSFSFSLLKIEDECQENACRSSSPPNLLAIILGSVSAFLSFLLISILIWWFYCRKKHEEMKTNEILQWRNEYVGQPPLYTDTLSQTAYSIELDRNERISSRKDSTSSHQSKSIEIQQIQIHFRFTSIFFSFSTDFFFSWIKQTNEEKRREIIQHQLKFVGQSLNRSI